MEILQCALMASFYLSLMKNLTETQTKSSPSLVRLTVLLVTELKWRLSDRERKLPLILFAPPPPAPPPSLSISHRSGSVFSRSVPVEMVTDKQLSEHWNKRDRGNLVTQRCTNGDVAWQGINICTRTCQWCYAEVSRNTYDNKCHWLIYRRWQLIIRHLIKLFDLIEFLLLF